MKLGKLPAREGAVKLKLATYLDTSILPPLPATQSGFAGLPADWGVLGNDRYGDCAWAGPAHEHMQLKKLGSGTPATFTTANVLSDYAAATGFDPVTGDNDNGTDMQQGAKYRQQVGIVDASGVRHKIGAYLALTPGNLHELQYAVYLFGTAGIGLQVPDYWMDEFNEGRPWDVRPNPQIEGGHYVPAVGYGSGFINIVTWGKVWKLTNAAYRKFNDETYAYVSTDLLNSKGTNSIGLNTAQLLADLKAVQGVK